MDGEKKPCFGAVLLGAGNSTRMGGEKSKVLESLGGKPVLAWSLQVLGECPWVGEVVLVCREEDRPAVEALAGSCPVPVQVVAGGAQRQDSVARGVEALSPRWEYLLIHDGARPLVTREVTDAVCRDAMAFGAATAAVPSKDTCKLGDEEGFVESTPPRERLWAVQTPQAFQRELYQRALSLAREAGQSYTDDCQLVEAAGCRVKLTYGDYRNLKLTTPEDRLAARAYTKGERTMRVGYGYDVHRLVEGRKLILAGVEIPFEKGLLGHSDADVVAHAVADALLGAVALGGHRPPVPGHGPPSTRGRTAWRSWGRCAGYWGEKGFSLGNVDVTLMAQRPKIAPYILEMRENLGRACGLPVERVSVKATTEEGLGFTGSGEGMSAAAVCLVEET